MNYFRAYVLRGPEAFLEIADGYEDYAIAMKRKLLKELEVITLSRSDTSSSSISARRRAAPHPQ